MLYHLNITSSSYSLGLLFTTSNRTCMSLTIRMQVVIGQQLEISH